MPNFTQNTIGVDTSGLAAGQSAVYNFFNTLNTVVGDSVTTLLKFNKAEEKVGEVIKTFATDGKILTENWGQVSQKISGQTVTSFEKLNSTITVATDKIRDMKKETIEFQKLQDKFKASSQADKFVGLRGLDTTKLTPNLQADLTRVHEKITKAIAQDLTGASTTLSQIQNQLRKGGTPGSEVGLRKEMQDAIILLDKFQIKLREAKRQTQVAPPGSTAQEFSAFTRDVSSRFQFGGRANESQVISFQGKLRDLFETAKKGTLTMAQLKTVFEKVVSDPVGSGKLFTASGGGGLPPVPPALLSKLQQVAIGYHQIQEATKRADEAQKTLTRGALLGLSHVARLIQAQVIHRVLGNLITDFTQSVDASNKFQQSLGEILTIGDRTGISFQGFNDQIRQLSIQFNKPPGDVAEAVYQALSNQIIKTAGDFSFMTEALKLARTTSSSAVAAVNALSSAINAFNLPISEAGRLGAQFFRMVDLGRFRLEDIQSTMGRVNVVAAQLGVSFEEVGGTLTAITRAGVPLSEAETQLSGIFQGLEKPSAAMATVFERLNVSSAETLIRLRGGFPAALRAILAEAQKVGISVSEIFPNIRGRRGIGLFQSGTNIEGDIAQLSDPNIQGQADAAGQRQAANVGEKFRSQMNNILTEMTTNFGPKLTAALLKIGEPFGGLDKLALKLIQTLSDLTAVGLQFASIISKIVATITPFLPSLTTLILLGGTYVGVLKSMEFATAAVKFINDAFGISLGTQMSARINKHINGLNGVTSATNTAASASAGLGISLKSIALSAGIGAIIGAATILIDKFLLARDAAEALNRTLENRARIDERQMRALDTSLSTQRAAFVTQSQAAERGFLSLLQPITATAVRLRNEGRNLLTSSTDNLRAALGVAADEIKDKISELEQRMRAARQGVRDSAKEIQKFRDEIGNTLFQERLNILGRGVSNVQAFKNPVEQQQAANQLSAERIVKNQQVALIAERIATLEEEAVEAGRRGDAAGIESARRKFEEIRRLTQQQFNLETEQQRRIFEFNLRAGGRSGTFIFRVNTEALRRNLDDVNNTQAEMERNFQNMQVRIEAESRALLNLERARERQITSSTRALAEFSVTNTQGELLPQFRGPEGLANAEAEFNRLAAAARAALAPITLTQAEMGRLQRDIGQNQASAIQRGLTEGTLTPEQVLQLGGAVTQARLVALQAQLQNHRATEEAMRDVERRIGEQRNAIAAQLTRERIAAEAKAREDAIKKAFEDLIASRDQAAQALRDNNASRREALASGGSNLGIIARGDAQGQHLGTFQGAPWNQQRAQIIATNDALKAAAAEAERLRVAAANSQAPADMEAYAAKLREVERLYEELLRRQTRFNDASQSGRDLNQVQLTPEAQEQLTRLREGRERIGVTTTGIQTAEDTLTRVNLQVQGMAGGIGGVGTNLNAVAIAAGDIGRNIAAGLNPATDSLRETAAAIKQMAEALQRLQGGAAVVVGPAAPRPQDFQGVGGDFGPVEGLAEGGLIGGRFNSHGPDDRLIAARGGEMIIKADATRKFYSTLVAINRGSFRQPRGFSQGGAVTTNVGDITINVPRGKDSAETARAVYKHLRRQIRRGSI